MATLEIIKQRIVALSPGKFQNMCDAYLNEKGYKNIVSLGSKPGTEKSTKGTPDTYCLDSDGKYIFVEYTTQQDNLYNKIQSDLKKCFDETKTKIVTTNISAIFYFHTTSNLTPGQDNTLKGYCSSKGVKLNIIGIDMLANDLYNKHKFLAKEYLDIAISTEQILTKNEFIKKYNNSTTSASIDTNFLFRETEIAKIDSVFSECNIVLLSGTAGVGKTRLAIEYAEKYLASNEASFYCIRNNNLPLYDDLHLFFSKEGNYIIVIDDANELGNLGNIIEFFRDKPYDYKIIITVRNYALNTVKEVISPLENFKEVAVDVFSDEEIEEFLKKVLGIINPDYIDRIIRISEGNARIAFLTGKIACEKNDLSSIRDVTSVYSEYYGQYLKENKIIDNKILTCAGIAAFVNVINLDRIENIKSIFAISKITENEFKSALYKLHEHEVVDIYKDKAVKFSDQCLSNYLLKYVFLDKKLIRLSEITKCYFTINKSRTVDSINIILNCFNNDDVHNYVTSEIKTIWNELEKEQSQNFWEFVKSFFIANTTSALILLNEKIDAKEPLIIPAEEIDINKNKNYQNVSDDILKILGGFSDTNELNDALELYFKYYLKCPNLYDQFYHIANLFYGIGKDYYRYGCYTTITFLEKMNEYSENWSNEYIILLFMGIAPEFLNIYFHNMESARNNKISYVTFSLQDSKGVRKYRSLIWNSLLTLVNNKKYYSKIVKILHLYGNGIDEKNSSIVNFESTFIMQLLNKLYIHSEVETSILCTHIKKVFDYAKVEYNTFFDKFFSNAEFQIYMVFKGTDYRSDIKYDEYCKNKRKNINSYIQKCDEIQFKRVIDMYIRIGSSIDSTWHINEGLIAAYDVIFETKDYFVSAIQYYLKCNTPGNFLSPIITVSRLFEKIDDTEVWNLICSCDYQNINYWQYAYFHELPECYIDETHTEKLFDFLKDDSDKRISSSPYRDVTFLHKHEKICPHSFINGCKTIMAKKEYSNFVVKTYFDLLFNHYSHKPKDVVESFYEDYQLLEDIYLLLSKNNTLTDYDGEFLKEFYTVNPNILVRFLNEKTEKISIEEAQRICRLFELDNYIEIFDFVMNQLISIADDNFYYSHYFVEALLAIPEEPITQERQNKWLEHYIKENCTNLTGMKMIFEVIANYSDDKKLNYMKIFLKNNQEYDSFKQLPILPNSYSWSDSEIPLIQKRIDFLKKLLALFTGISWIKHKKYIEELIESTEEEMKTTELYEIMYGV